VLALVAGCQTVSLDLTVSNRRYSAFLSTFRRQQLYSIVKMTSEMHFNAFQCIAQPNTTLLDCIMYLTQYLYDPGILPALQTSVSWERVSELQSTKDTFTSRSCDGQSA